jgi:iron complex outermembrane receptor protein
MLLRSASALALGAALFTVSAHAQTTSEVEEDVIVVTGTAGTFGATKSDTPIVETARTISVETSDMFIDKGALNLSQTVSYFAGVTAETYGFATRGDWVSSRGLDVPRYRDSIQELFGSYNTTRADIYTIEQVELLKGPASVLYGQGSPGGILNYVSKTPRDAFGGELVAELGNFDRYQIAGDVTGPVSGTNGQLLYRLVGLYRDTGSQIDEMDETTSVLMPSLTFMPREDTRLTVIGLFQDTESDVAAQFIPVEGTLNPLPDGSFLDPTVYTGNPDFNHYDTKSNQITLLAEHELNDALTFAATALWREGDADYAQAWPVFTGAGVSRYLDPALGFSQTTAARSFYAARSASEQLAADARVIAEFRTGVLEHEVLAGVAWQTVATDSDTAYFYGGGALSGDFSGVLDLANPVYGNGPSLASIEDMITEAPTQHVSQTGIYVSDQIAVGNWRITAGLRADSVTNDDGSVEQDDDALSGSIGVLYRLPNGLSPYASYSESFQPVVGTTLGGDQLEPEEARQYEIGFKYEPEGLPGLITVAWYDIEISNLPNPNSLPGDAAQQQGVSTLTGIEAEARLQLGDVYLQAAAATIDAEDPNGFELAAQPNGNAALWASWRPSGQWNGFKAGAGVRHVGESVSENGTVRYETPSYTLGDLMVGYEWETWDFQVNARNVTDEEYLTSCLTRGDCFPGLQRSVVATLRRSF